MCSHGSCVSAHCEKCRPKWMKCPVCGEKTGIMLRQCSICKTELTKEARDTASVLWRQKKAEREERKHLEKASAEMKEKMENKTSNKEV
ncbi:hypothetical protein LPY66_18475 [Dehalobacter sp. DCM]|uniref:hypothetical protein n=1 Tax=Dehalobacter sp. DCM TaxID=2907827 RepID=UPI0030817AB3|nr:hypothetical protein LPY66_18475 [Dehalobacter sp. DCM]